MNKQMSKHTVCMIVISSVEKNKSEKGDKECCFVLLACLAIFNRVVRERY